MSLKNKVLILAPHADDEILGCGGVIAKHVVNGDEVNVAVLTNASVGAPEIFSSSYVDVVRSEARDSHSSLGVSQTRFYDLPAPQLEQYPQYKVADLIKEIISEVEANILYIPHRGDLHLDHRVIYNSALVAARPIPGQRVKKVYAYETLSETEWGHPTSDSVFIPNRFVSLSDDEMNKKLKAMSLYKTQLKEFPNARSLEAIEYLARYRGASVGQGYAEAFVVVRELD